MKKLNLLLALAFSVLLTGNIFAQEEKKEEEKKSEFIVNAEFRPRTEFSHGYKSPVLKYSVPNEYTYPGSLATSQRTRIGFNYKYDKIKFGLQLQDIRTWGSQAQLTADDTNDMFVHQAWGEINFSDKFSLKAGRMELVYDDHRILGSVGWAQQARSHDLALFKYEGNIKVHLGIAYHGGPFTGNDAYKAMQFLWINGKAADFGYSILALNNGVAERGYWGPVAQVAESNAYSQILGGRFTYQLGDLNLALNSYYQTGKKAADWIDPASLPNGVTAGDLGYEEKSGQGQEIAAYNFAFDAMYKISDGLKIGAGYEILSGNDLTDVNRTDENAFTPLYGTNHKFNGWMDYFYVGNHGSSIGLQDINLKILYKNGPFFAKLIPHYFLPAGKGTYTDVNAVTHDIGALGTEVDFVVGYNIIPKTANIQFGYSQMFATESMYGLKGVVPTADNPMGTNNWIWAMIVIKPTLFKSVK